MAHRDALRQQLRLVSVLSADLIFVGSGGWALALWKGDLPVTLPILVVLVSMVPYMIGLAATFLIRSYSQPFHPIPQVMRISQGKMWASLLVVLFWFALGGGLMYFLLDIFFGWEHLPMAMGVLVGLHLVPLGDAFSRP